MGHKNKTLPKRPDGKVDDDFDLNRALRQARNITSDEDNTDKRLAAVAAAIRHEPIDAT